MSDGNDPASDYSFVARSGFRALTTPTFIIQVGHKYYVSTAVLEYDPREARDDDQRRGVARIAELFEEAGPTLQAAAVDKTDSETTQATRPPPQDM